MMYLLDTHVVIWAMADDKAKLGKRLYDIITDATNVCYVSAISLWEIEIKTSLGRLDVPDDIMSALKLSGFKCINLEPSHIKELRKLPNHHKDPFDRMLIAQADATSMQLLTVNSDIQKYFKR